MTALRVGIAIVSRAGRYLVRQRPANPGSPMPGVWEFPGGKCEPGEPPEVAAVRECREETGLAVVAVRLRHSREHHYPHGRVELHYYDCEPIDPSAQAEGGFLWVAGADLSALTFPDANAEILRTLAAGGSG